MTDTASTSQECFFCKQKFPYGLGSYLGRFLPGYNLYACSTCYAANHDGWAPHFEEALLGRLHANFLKAKREENGCLVRDFI